MFSKLCAHFVNIEIMHVIFPISIVHASFKKRVIGKGTMTSGKFEFEWNALMFLNTGTEPCQIFTCHL